MQKRMAWRDTARLLNQRDLNQPLISQDYGEGIKGDIYKALSATSGI